MSLEHGAPPDNPPWIWGLGAGFGDSPRWGKGLGPSPIPGPVPNSVCGWNGRACGVAQGLQLRTPILASTLPSPCPPTSPPPPQTEMGAASRRQAAVCARPVTRARGLQTQRASSIPTPLSLPTSSIQAMELARTVKTNSSSKIYFY